MQRIDGPTRAAALPAAIAAGTGPASPGFFAHPDPAGGVAPTTMTPDWGNSIQEELIAIIIAAGLTPDKANNAQVLAALDLLFAPRTAPSFTVDSDGSTWRRVGPDGFIECGGIASIGTTNEQQVTLTFPVAFPNQCLGVSCMSISTGSTLGNTQMQEASLATDHAMLFAQSDSHPFSDATSFRWRAWGR